MSQVGNHRFIMVISENHPSFHAVHDSANLLIINVQPKDLITILNYVNYAKLLSQGLVKCHILPFIIYNMCNKNLTAQKKFFST